MRSRKNNKKVFLLILVLILLSISIGYAYLTQILKINHTASIAKTTWDVHFENAIINKESTKEFTPVISEDKTIVSTTIDFKEPGDFYEYTIDIVNKGTVDAMVFLVEITNLTTEQQKYLEYKITYEDGEEIKTNDLLSSGKKETVKVRVNFKRDIEESDLPSEEITITIEAKINYVQADEKASERTKGNKLYNILNTQAIEDSEISFGDISSETNGKGLYKLTKIETSTPIYYYRGNVDNNYVLFGRFCWRIIRTTETGGVKLLYNGTPNNGVCDATGVSTEIGKSVYNENADDPKYVGYMYDDNTKNSTVKTVVDTWFENNLLSYQGYLEDTPFYNERDYTDGTGYPMHFAPKNRIWGNGTTNPYINIANTKIKLGAANAEDIFTVSSEIGNGALTYPVGLLTSDEVIMAGGKGWQSGGADLGDNKDFYLYNNSIIWTISPYQYHSTNFALVLSIGMNGAFYWTRIADVEGGVRPVVSLKPRTNYLSGNGTKESPYIITQ